MAGAANAAAGGGETALSDRWAERLVWLLAGAVCAALWLPAALLLGRALGPVGWAAAALAGLGTALVVLVAAGLVGVGVAATDEGGAARCGSAARERRAFDVEA